MLRGYRVYRLVYSAGVNVMYLWRTLHPVWQPLWLVCQITGYYVTVACMYCLILFVYTLLVVTKVLHRLTYRIEWGVYYLYKAAMWFIEASRFVIIVLLRRCLRCRIHFKHLHDILWHSMSWHEDAVSVMCPICGPGLTAVKPVVIIPCGHTSCSSCLNEWHTVCIGVDVHPRCPLCNSIYRDTIRIWPS